MDETGLWRLFFLTGLPEVYLVMKRGQPSEQKTLQPVPAFAPEPKKGEMV